MCLEFSFILRNSIEYSAHTMPQVVADNIADKKNCERNPKRRISQIHEVFFFEIEAVGHKKMRVMHQVFQHYGGKASKYADDEAEKDYQLTIFDVTQTPNQHFPYDCVCVHFCGCEITISFGEMAYFHTRIII